MLIISLYYPCRVRYSLSDRTSASPVELKSQKIRKNVANAVTNHSPLLPASIQIEKKLTDDRIFSDRENSERSCVEVEVEVEGSQGGQLDYSSSDSLSRTNSKKVSRSDSSPGSSPDPSTSESSKKVPFNHFKKEFYDFFKISPNSHFEKKIQLSVRQFF